MFATMVAMVLATDPLGTAQVTLLDRTADPRCAVRGEANTQDVAVFLVSDAFGRPLTAKKGGRAVELVAFAGKEDALGYRSYTDEAADGAKVVAGRAELRLPKHARFWRVSIAAAHAHVDLALGKHCVEVRAPATALE